MGSTEKYVARAAMEGLLDNHQGNQVLDDGIWDSIYAATGDDKEAKLLAIQELQKIVDVIAGMLEISGQTSDEVLAQVWELGMQEIEERFEV